MSRKLRLLYIVLIIATIGAFLPPTIAFILSIYKQKLIQFTILGSTEWITVVSLLVTSYFGANHFDKRLAISNGISPDQLDKTCIVAQGSLKSTASTQNQINQKQQVQAIQNNTVSDEESYKRGKI